MAELVVRLDVVEAVEPIDRRRSRSMVQRQGGCRWLNYRTAAAARRNTAPLGPRWIRR